MKISESNLCPMCHIEVETIKHAFLECPDVIAFWFKIENWLKTKTHQNVKLSNLDKIFGIQDQESLLEKNILNAKVLIFNSRKNGKKHNMLDLKRKMFRQLQIEEYQARMNQNERKMM